jgi:large subunit ribosomal protein L7/L12
MADEVKVPEKFKKIVEELAEMKVMDLAELVKVLEEKFGVSAAAPVAVAAAPVAAADAGEEKSEFDIILKAPGDKKIEVIKVVRDITQKGLKESKDLVDLSATEPQMIKERAKKEEAEEIKKKFIEAGATVELK